MEILDEEEKDLIREIMEEAFNTDTSRPIELKITFFEKAYVKLKEKFGDFILRHQLPEVY